MAYIVETQRLLCLIYFLKYISISDYSLPKTLHKVKVDIFNITDCMNALGLFADPSSLICSIPNSKGACLVNNNFISKFKSIYKVL